MQYNCLKNFKKLGKGDIYLFLNPNMNMLLQLHFALWKFWISKWDFLYYYCISDGSYFTF